MGFTIEDMLVVSSDRYQMKLVAGEKGWSNSVSWLLMLEDLTIIQNFRGKELAVTTGLGFQSEKEMLALVEALSKHSASGLIVNTGHYITEIPASVREVCDRNELPLLTVPWEVYLADMIKDLSIRIFLQTSADEQISGALICAIEEPEARDRYVNELLPYFDLDGSFQCALVSTGDLDRMDTVERRRLGYRMQLSLTNLTHNGHFFYYAGCFVIIINALSEELGEEILRDFAGRVRKRVTSPRLYIGVSDPVKDVTNLHLAYRRARAAKEMARDRGESLVFFKNMGIYRLLYCVEDRELLRDLSEKPLAPLLAYDREHRGEYVRTLASYLFYGGSIKAMADDLYVHRNTILYRMAHIRELLETDLENPEDKLAYIIACMISRMYVHGDEETADQKEGEDEEDGGRGGEGRV